MIFVFVVVYYRSTGCSGHLTITPESIARIMIGVNFTITVRSNTSHTPSHIICHHYFELYCPVGGGSRELYNSYLDDVNNYGVSNLRSRVHVVKRSRIDFDIVFAGVKGEDQGCYSCQEYSDVDEMQSVNVIVGGG